MKTKICTGCAKEKPATTEYFNIRLGELRSRCIVCVGEYMKDYCQRTKPARLEYGRKYARDNKDKIREYAIKNADKLKLYRTEYGKRTYNVYYNLKRGAEKRNILILEKKEFIKWHDTQKKICYYCGLKEEELSIVKGIRKTNRLSIDRKDNSIGYETGNMVLACYTCNNIKNNFLTEQDMIEIGKKYIAPKWREQLS